MESALFLATHLLLKIPTEIQTYSLQECREMEGIVRTVHDKNNQPRIACVFFDGEFA